MKSTIQPEARAWFIRLGLLNVCIGAMGTLVLVLAGLYLPQTLADRWIAYVGAIVGCLMAMSVYGVWGGASCLADINVFGLTSLTAFGSGAIRSMICDMLPERDSPGLLANALNSCAPHSSRAIELRGALQYSELP